MTATVKGFKNYSYSTINLAYGCGNKDNNTVIYKRDEQGNKVLKRVILGPGWETIPFLPQCEIGKGESELAHRTGPHPAWLDWATLMPQVRDLAAEGRTLPEVARILGIKPNTLQRHMQDERKKKTPAESPLDRKKALIAKFKAQQQTPEPVPPAKQEPAQEAESADKIITLDGQFEGDCPKCGAIGEVMGEGHLRRWVTTDGEEMCYDCYAKEAGIQRPPYTAPLKGSSDECDKPEREGWEVSPARLVEPPQNIIAYAAGLAFDGSFNPETFVNPEHKYTAPLKGSYDECDGEKICPSDRFIQAINDGRINRETDPTDPIAYKIPKYMPHGEEYATFNGETPIGITRKASWNKYRERTADEKMIQGWAADVFKHHGLSREKKLELIGWLLVGVSE